MLARKTKWTEWAGPARQRQHLQGARASRLDDDAASRRASTSATAGRGARERGEEALGDVRVPVREARADRSDRARSPTSARDGTVYVHMSTAQNPQAMRWELAMMLNTPIDKVVVRNYDGSGHYGRSNGGSTGAEDEAVDPLAGRRQAGPAAVDALGRHAVVDAAPAGVLGRAGRPRRERQARLVPGRPLHAGDAGRPHGRRAARRAADDPGAERRRRIPGTFGSTPNGISDPWVYDQVPNALQTGFGTFQIGTDPKAPTSTRRSGCATTACARRRSGSRTSRRSR